MPLISKWWKGDIFFLERVLLWAWYLFFDLFSAHQLTVLEKKGWNNRLWHIYQMFRYIIVIKWCRNIPVCTVFFWGLGSNMAASLSLPCLLYCTSASLFCQNKKATVHRYVRKHCTWTRDRCTHNHTTISIFVIEIWKVRTRGGGVEGAMGMGDVCVCRERGAPASSCDCVFFPSSIHLSPPSINTQSSEGAEFN